LNAARLKIVGDLVQSSIPRFIEQCNSQRTTHMASR
jgi:hypothetical protein